MTQWKLYATKHLMLLIYIKGNFSIRYQSWKTVCLSCIWIQTATNLYFLKLVTTRLRDVPRSKSLYTIVIRNIQSDNWLFIRNKLNYFVLPDKNEIRVIRRQRRLLGVIILAPFFLLIEVQPLVRHLIERNYSEGNFPEITRKLLIAEDESSASLNLNGILQWLIITYRNLLKTPSVNLSAIMIVRPHYLSGPRLVFKRSWKA